jgi:hypothetical protein
MRKHKIIAGVSSVTALASLMAFHKLATTGGEMLLCLILCVTSIAVMSKMLSEIEDRL